MAEFRKQMLKGKKSSDEIMDAISKGNPSPVSRRDGRFNHGDNEVMENLAWKPGLSELVQRNNLWYLVDFKQVLPVTPKSLDEARGVITADYQTYLEKEWLQSLRGRYKVDVDESVLHQMWK